MQEFKFPWFPYKFMIILEFCCYTYFLHLEKVKNISSGFRATRDTFAVVGDLVLVLLEINELNHFCIDEAIGTSRTSQYY